MPGSRRSGPRSATRPSASVVPRATTVPSCSSVTATPAAGRPRAVSRTCVVTWLIAPTSSSRSRAMSRSAVTVSARSASSSLYSRRRSSARISALLRPAARTRKTWPKRCSYVTLAARRRSASRGPDARLLAPRVPGLRAVGGGPLADPGVPGERGGELVVGEVEGGVVRPLAQRGGVGIGPAGHDLVDPAAHAEPAGDERTGVVRRQGVELIDPHLEHGKRGAGRCDP